MHVGGQSCRFAAEPKTLLDSSPLHAASAAGAERAAHGAGPSAAEIQAGPRTVSDVRDRGHMERLLWRLCSWHDGQIHRRRTAWMPVRHEVVLNAAMIGWHVTVNPYGGCRRATCMVMSRCRVADGWAAECRVRNEGRATEEAGDLLSAHRNRSLTAVAGSLPY